jgi:D-serine deaminase-like pyridoxal phosphate-dependent protein
MKAEVFKAAASLKMCRDRIKRLMALQEASGETNQQISKWVEVEADTARALVNAVLDSLYPEDDKAAGLNVRELSNYALITASNIVSRFVAMLEKMAEIQNATLGNVNPHVLLNMIEDEKRRRGCELEAGGWIDQIIAGDVEEEGMR